MRPVQEDQPASPFTPSVTRSILMTACRDVGLDSTDAVLLRDGENAVYRLAHHPVVIRIARHADVPRLQVAVAAWLAHNDLPAVRVCDGVEQLVVIDARVVTWWDLIVESQEKLAFVDLASVLRRLHDLPPPPRALLPAFDAMPRVLGRVTSADVTKADREFLVSRHADLSAAYAALSFELGDGPIHGDAHLGNLMRRKDGTVVLIDLEAFAWGPREWDASVFAAATAGIRSPGAARGRVARGRRGDRAPARRPTPR